MDQILQYSYMGVGGVIAVTAVILMVLRLRHRDDSRLSRYRRGQLKGWSWFFGIVLFAAWLILTYLVVIK